jgi:Mg2+-importing ATPase
LVRWQTIVGTRTQTAFDRGVNSVSWLLIRFMLVMVPIVLLINGFSKGDWVEASLFALAVAVA